MKRIILSILSILIFFSIQSFGWEVFFNSPPSSVKMRESILTLLESARYSIHLAIYNLDDEEIISLLNEKMSQGVDVKLVMEGENYVKNIKKLSSLDVVADPIDNGLMHSKYLIVDGHIVWFGSTNFTNSSFYKDLNNSLIFDSENFAEALEIDFKKMREGYFEESRNSEIAKIMAEGIRIDLAFSPSEESFNSLIDALKSAKEEVDVAIYSFSDARIALTLIALDEKGVKVRILADDEWNSSTYSFVPEMEEFKFLRKFKNIKGLFHNKYIVIDPMTDRAKVITGSYNLTLSAEQKNSEIITILYSKEIAQLYMKNFDLLWAK
jgi:phosphatidylserine/phosphatidylglycerophosphate/cardiolipin synthase-like enzyme|uniref:phospholipase D n=1 Tax=Mesoaciditoga lauensis TaxID=1495039 RepID=A0A7V3RE33_9BACT